MGVAGAVLSVPVLGVVEPEGRQRAQIVAAGLKPLEARMRLQFGETVSADGEGETPTVPLFEAAGYLGMSAATLEQVYGHHHLDFQNKAATYVTAPVSPRNV